MIREAGGRTSETRESEGETQERGREKAVGKLAYAKSREPEKDTRNAIICVAAKGKGQVPLETD